MVSPLTADQRPTRLGNPATDGVGGFAGPLEPPAPTRTETAGSAAGSRPGATPSWERLQAAVPPVDPVGVNRVDGRGPEGSGARHGDTGDDAPGADAPAAKVAGLSPTLLAYAVGPVALVVLLVLRHFGLVASAPVWAYAAGDRRAADPEPSARAVAGRAARLAAPARSRDGPRRRGHLGDLPQRLGPGAGHGVRLLRAGRSPAVGRGRVARRARVVVDGLRRRPASRVRGLDAVVPQRLAGADDRLPRSVRVRDRDPDGRSDRRAQGARRRAPRGADVAGVARATTRSRAGTRRDAARRTIEPSSRTRRRASSPSASTDGSTRSTPPPKRCSDGRPPRSWACPSRRSSPRSCTTRSPSSAPACGRTGTPRPTARTSRSRVCAATEPRSR